MSEQSWWARKQVIAEVEFDNGTTVQLRATNMAIIGLCVFAALIVFIVAVSVFT